MAVNREGASVPACAEPTRHAKRAPKSSRRRSGREPSRTTRRASAKSRRRCGSVPGPGRVPRELLARRLPKGSVVGLIEQVYIRSTEQLPAEAACDCWRSTPRRQARTPAVPRAADELMRYTEGGDAPPPAGGPGAGVRPRRAQSAGVGAIRRARPAVVAHLRFLEGPGTGAATSRTSGGKTAEAFEE